MQRFGVAMLAGSLLLAACAEKPSVEVIEAQQALAAARDAEADRYAPEEFDLAVMNLQGAIDAIEEQDEQALWARNYTLAFDLLALSVEQSNAAVEIADSIRVEASFAAELLLPQVQESIDTAFAELERARRTNVVSRAQIDRLDADLGFSARLLSEARANFDSADYEAALDQARQAMELSDSVRLQSAEINQLALEVELELGQP